MSAPAAPRASRTDLLGWRMRALLLDAASMGASSVPSVGPAVTGSAPAKSAPAKSVPAKSATAGAAQIVAVARHMLAMQGQDWNTVRWALGVRSPGSTLADVYDAFADGRLVRSWPMRGTVHVVAAEDIGWMQTATSHRILPGAPKRRAFIELDDASLARMTDVAVAELSGGNRLSRAGLVDAWLTAGIEVPGPWRYHVIWWLCQNQILVQGPVEDDEPLLVLADEWITAPRRLDGDEALAELAARFAEGRGPILEKDLAWWTGLTVTESRRAIAAAHDAGRLTPVDITQHAVDTSSGASSRTSPGADTPVEGKFIRYWADPALLDAPPANLSQDPRTLLLPGFDEHLLGYTERSAMLDPEHFARIVPGKNGVFRGTVVKHGRVTGTWLRELARQSATFTVTPFPDHALDSAALEPAIAAWGAFHGVQTTADIVDTS